MQSTWARAINSQRYAPGCRPPDPPVLGRAHGSSRPAGDAAARRRPRLATHDDVGRTGADIRWQGMRHMNLPGPILMPICSESTMLELGFEHMLICLYILPTSDGRPSVG
jgi:hypothetical protein